MGARMVISHALRVKVGRKIVSALAHQRLLIVTGKGGVGKTTLSAALALGSARRGLKTLVCEINTKERVTTLLGRPEVGAEIGSLEENLWAVNVRPAEALREYALMILKFESIYNAVFGNRLVSYFLRFIPSIAEITMLGKILFHLRELRPDGTYRFDRIVIDAPATGHAITFLSVPQVVIETVPPGPLAQDATWMRDLLVDPKITGTVLVSLPEELPVNETLELHQALTQRVKLATTATVLNGFIPSRFSQDERAHLPVELADVARVHELRATLSTDAERRLATLPAPLIRVPRLYTPTFGRQAIEAVEKALGGLLDRSEG
jgi:anion-transporting  ArsA/GET3 family ATPase